MQTEMDAHRNIERNIVKEIMRECFPKKIYPNEHFVAYFIKLLLLDPNWGITDDFLTSRENVANFVAFVISELEGRSDPKLITLQMQFYFTCNMDNMTNLVKKSRNSISDRLIRLKNEILRLTNTDSHDEIENLIKLIVNYITLISGMGNPLESEVYQEALAAFKSVMNEEEVKEFMMFSSEEKEVHIKELIKVVSGIRLFNKDSELGGAGIQDLPMLLEKALCSIKDEVQNVLMSVMEKVNILTTVVDKCYVLDKDRKDGHSIMVYKAPTDSADFNIEYIKNILIFYRQYELFIRKLLDNLQNIEELSSEICEKFQCILKEIYRIVTVKIAIPARIVFPLFEALTDRWTDLQDQVMILVRYNKIMNNLMGFSKNLYFHKDFLESLLEPEGGHTDAERLQETASLRIKSDNPELEITDLANFPNIDNIHLQYLGFCSWKLVQTEGGLIPGNPGMGVATYQKKNFVFSIPQACTEFSRQPLEVINAVLNMGRKKPHLINFLLLKEHLDQVMDIFELAKVKDFVKHTDDKMVQCTSDTESNIDPTYFWNIWDLKRQALQLANLSKRKTVSTQTHKSHFINTVNTQTYEMREKETQTKKDNYSNVPTLSNFIFGLRGRKDDKQFIIELTRPVAEH